MSDTRKVEMFNALSSAWALWVTAGVTGMQFEMGTQNECNNAQTVLTVIDTTDDTDPQLSTSFGMAGPTQGGARMKLALRTSTTQPLGFGDDLANFAHEIGHAWGLIHEHQRYDLWSTQFDGGSNRDTFNFQCANLRAFQDWLRMKGYAADGQPAEQACHSHATADRERFDAAVEFLPLPRQAATVRTKFDPLSIMLYSSAVGAIPGTSVLTYADGGLIVPNLFPSQLDVRTLMSLYGLPPPQDSANCLYYMSCSPFQNLFNSINSCTRR